MAYTRDRRRTRINSTFIKASKSGASFFSNCLELIDAAELYFIHVAATDVTIIDAIKSGTNAGESVEVETMRPYTLHGLRSFLGVTPNVWIKQRKTDQFGAAIALIEDLISADQITGAMIGAYNANLVSRLNGFAEKQEIGGAVESTVKHNITAEDIKMIKDAFNRSF